MFETWTFAIIYVYICILYSCWIIWISNSIQLRLVLQYRTWWNKQHSQAPKTSAPGLLLLSSPHHGWRPWKWPSTRPGFSLVQPAFGFWMVHGYWRVVRWKPSVVQLAVIHRQKKWARRAPSSGKLSSFQTSRLETIWGFWGWAIWDLGSGIASVQLPAK